MIKFVEDKKSLQVSVDVCISSMHTRIFANVRIYIYIYIFIYYLAICLHTSHTSGAVLKDDASS